MFNTRRNMIKTMLTSKGSRYPNQGMSNLIGLSAQTKHYSFVNLIFYGCSFLWYLLLCLLWKFLTFIMSRIYLQSVSIVTLIWSREDNQSRVTRRSLDSASKWKLSGLIAANKCWSAYLYHPRPYHCTFSKTNTSILGCESCWRAAKMKALMSSTDRARQSTLCFNDTSCQTSLACSHPTKTCQSFSTYSHHIQGLIWY